MIEHLQADKEDTKQLSERELADFLYREGKLSTLAKYYTLSHEDKAERARLAQLFASDTLASDIVIEDRGSY